MRRLLAVVAAVAVCVGLLHLPLAGAAAAPGGEHSPAARASGAAWVRLRLITPPGMPAQVVLTSSGGRQVALKPASRTARTSTVRLRVRAGAVYRVSGIDSVRHGALYAPRLARRSVTARAGSTSTFTVRWTRSPTPATVRVAAAAPRSMSLSWRSSGGVGARFAVRRSRGYRAPATDHAGRRAYLGTARGVTVRGLRPGTVYSFGLFVKPSRTGRWAGPVRLTASTAPATGSSAPPKATFSLAQDALAATPAASGGATSAQGDRVAVRSGHVWVTYARWRPAPVLGAGAALPASRALPAGYVGTVAEVGPGGRTARLVPGSLPDVYATLDAAAPLTMPARTLRVISSQPADGVPTLRGETARTTGRTAGGTAYTKIVGSLANARTGSSDGYVAYVPTSRARNIRLMIWNHPYTSPYDDDVAGRGDDHWTFALTSWLLDHGIALAASNDAGDNFGSASVMTAIDNLYGAIDTAMKVRTLVQYGESMGCTAALNWAARHAKAPLAGVMSISGFCDTSLAKAAGYDGDYAPAYNPMLESASSWAGLPVFMESSAADTTAEESANTLAWIKHAGGAAVITHVEGTGNHLAAGNYPVTAMESWIRRVMGIGSASTASGGTAGARLSAPLSASSGGCTLGSDVSVTGPRLSLAGSFAVRIASDGSGAPAAADISLRLSPAVRLGLTAQTALSADCLLRVAAFSRAFPIPGTPVELTVAWRPRIRATFALQGGGASITAAPSMTFGADLRAGPGASLHRVFAERGSRPAWSTAATGSVTAGLGGAAELALGGYGGRTGGLVGLSGTLSPLEMRAADPVSAGQPACATVRMVGRADLALRPSAWAGWLAATGSRTLIDAARAYPGSPWLTPAGCGAGTGG